MTDPNKVTLAECIDYATRARGILHGLANGNSRALPDPGQNARVMATILSHLRSLQGVEEGTHVVVPVELLTAGTIRVTGGRSNSILEIYFDTRDGAEALFNVLSTRPGAPE